MTNGIYVTTVMFLTELRKKGTMYKEKIISCVKALLEDNYAKLVPQATTEERMIPEEEMKTTEEKNAIANIGIDEEKENIEFDVQENRIDMMNANNNAEKIVDETSFGYEQQLSVVKPDITKYEDVNLQSREDVGRFVKLVEMFLEQE